MPIIVFPPPSPPPYEAPAPTNSYAERIQDSEDETAPVYVKPE